MYISDLIYSRSWILKSVRALFIGMNFMCALFIEMEGVDRWDNSKHGAPSKKKKKASMEQPRQVQNASSVE